jgi:penicillin-binding protein 1B
MSPPEAVFIFVAEFFSALSERVVQALTYLGFIAEDLGLAEQKKRRHALFLTVFGLLVLIFAVFFAYQFIAYKSMARLVETRLAAGSAPSRAGLYAAPRTLHTGQELTQEDLTAMLQRGGYGACDVKTVGCYAQSEKAVVFHPYLDEEATAREQVELAFAQGRLESITADGVIYDRYRLDPELLAYQPNAEAQTLSYNDLPPALVKSLLVLEGKDFLSRRGADWRGAAGGVWRNLWGGAEERQPATISQQLARDTYLMPEKTRPGVFAAPLLALALEQRLTREEILALYCDKVYLGQRGVTGLYGFPQGARVIFGKSLKELTLGETATLLGLLQSPQRYAPDRNPQAALAQRNAVLNQLAHEQAISGEELAAASREPLTLAPYKPPPGVFAPYFTDYANRATGDKLSAAPVPDEASLRVYTTLEPEVQAAAEKSLRQRLEQIAPDKTQGALVALDAKTGRIVALVGGRDYAASPLNRATDAARIPGATFWPVIYAAALEQNVSPLESFTDAPRAFTYENASYAPLNEGNVYANRAVPLRDGLVSSLNVVATDASLRIGLDKVVNVANRLGLPQKTLTPAMALGVNETTPLALASAYSAFANGGLRVPANALIQAQDGRGNPVFAAENAAPEAIFSPSVAFMVTHALTAVMEEGAGKEAQIAVGEKTALAGKNSAARDGWFVGYTPSLVCAVWLGNDDGAPLENGGAEALKVWTEFIKEATAIRTFGGEEFSKPEDVRLFKVDLDNNKLANGYCHRQAETALLAEQVPVEECADHTRETVTAKAEPEPAKTPLLLPPLPGGRIKPASVSLPPAVTTAAPRQEPEVKPSVQPPAQAAANPAPRQTAAPNTPPLVLAPPVVNTRPPEQPRRLASKETPARPSR